VELKAMNIFDVQTPAATEQSSMKGASLSSEAENPQFAFLMGQSLQLPGGELPEALSHQELMNITVDVPDSDIQLSAEVQKEGLKTESEENQIQPQIGNIKRNVAVNIDNSPQLPLQKNMIVDKTPSQLDKSVELSARNPELELQGSPHKELTDYLEALNAKEIRIVSRQQMAKVSSEPVMPVIENAQVANLVRSNIRRTNAEHQTNLSKLAEGEIVTEEHVIPVAEERRTNGDQLNKRNELVIEKDANLQKGVGQESKTTRFDSVLKVENIETGSLVKTNITTVEPLTQIRTKADGEIVETVKIILPEKLKLNSGQKTQSIMIRIEPEQLGPARLELKMTNEILTAKLIVETPEAKQILEGSLSHLKDRLAAADIEVEDVEINVRSESHNSNMFEKQSGWQNQKSVKHLNELNDGFTDIEPVAVNAPVKESLQYVGSGGVNLLA
jgi:flagellar hook-length control protein FliK